MNPEQSDLSTERKLSLRADDAVRRHPAIRVLLLILPAVVSALVAYTGSTSAGRTESGVVKDKAESGYQATKNALEDLRDSNRELQARLAKVELDLTALRRSIKVVRRAPAAAPAKVAPPPRALPADLDKALEQVQSQPPAPTSPPPPGP